MVIEVKLSQPENALSPMLLMLLGMVIEVKLEQLKNALSSILFTLLGIITEVKLWQHWKAPAAILVTLYECSPYVILSGITTGIGAFFGAIIGNISKTIIAMSLGFAAGAMLYVVVEELIPEAVEGEHSHIGTIMFSLGFSIMMVLDVALG